MTHEEYFDFPVVHKDFYTVFEPWRQSQNRQGLLKEGVYYLLAGKPVPRCFKEDPNGILYIGRGKILDVNHRLGKLINSLNDTDRMHEAGIRYNSIRFLDKYPLNAIKLRVVLNEHPRQLESKLLMDYMNEFGELPPLNHQQ